MGDDHVAIGAGLLVEADPVADVERLRHVDLNVVDEIAVPDRLEQPVGEAEGEDVLRRLLAEEMIDPEDLLLVENLVQLRVQRDRGFEIDAERLLHDDARASRQIGVAEHLHGLQRRARRDAQIVHEPAFPAERLGRAFDRLLQSGRTGGKRNIVEQR